MREKYAAPHIRQERSGEEYLPRAICMKQSLSSCFLFSPGLEDALPVQLAAVDLEKGGVSWMKETLPGKVVWFTSLTRNDHLNCVVSAKMVSLEPLFWWEEKGQLCF